MIGIRAGDNTVQRVDAQSGSQTTAHGVRVDPLSQFTVIADSATAFAWLAETKLTRRSASQA